MNGDSFLLPIIFVNYCDSELSPIMMVIVRYHFLQVCWFMTIIIPSHICNGNSQLHYYREYLTITVNNCKS